MEKIWEIDVAYPPFSLLGAGRPTYLEEPGWASLLPGFSTSTYIVHGAEILWYTTHTLSD